MRRSPVSSRSWVPARLATALALTGTLALALGSAPAHAVPKGTVSFIGESGTGAGQFSTPGGVAVKESTGHVYVADSGNHRIQEFDELGMFVRTWGWGVQTGAAVFEVCSAPGPCLPGIEGAGAGQMDRPQGVAVDQDTGEIYATSPDNLRVDKFEADGDFMFAFGWGVATNAAAFEKCTTTCRAGRSGAAAGQFATTFAGHPAVDPRNGDVVVADSENRRVQRFESDGDFLFAFGWGVDTNAAALQTCTAASTCQAGRNGSGVGQFSNDQPVRVAVDSAGSVYTAESGTQTGNRRVQKFNATASSAGVFAPEETSGVDDSSTPTDVGIDSRNDHVLVAKDGHVLEFNGVGDLVETHAAGGGLPRANGMAVDGTSNRIYLTTTPDQRVFVLGQVTPPSATIAPPTSVMATTATFNGMVNPGGGALRTGYHFEYSDNAGFSWTSVPVPDTDVGNGTTPVPATHAAVGLEPNTQYRVRLVARRPFAGGSATSGFTTFTTPAAPPDVSGVGAREVTDTTAVLAGSIDPNRSQTTYRFEYGTDTGYGSVTPTDSAGAGPSRVPAVKQIAGLQPNTTYHFRLVASSAAGTTEGPDSTFTTAAAPPQPSGRVYEMVSPLDKNGGNVERIRLTGTLSSQTGAAPSGNAVAYVSRVQFGNIESGTLNPNYVARRGSDGWLTEGISPPIGNVPPSQIELPSVQGVSPDLSKAFVKAAAPLTPNAGMLNGSWGMYMRSSGEAQRYTLLSFPWQQLTADSSFTRSPGRFDFAASTPDSRHVVFNSRRKLISDAPADRDTPGDPNAVYEWVDGTLRLVSVLPTGLFVPASGIEGALAGGATAATSETGDLPGDHPISADGRRVFFTAAVNEGSATGPSRGLHLWVREDGLQTRHVSRSQIGSDPLAGSSGPRFWGAKRSDGSVAFFTNDQPLTAGATSTTRSLYRWDAGASDGAALTELTPDPAGDPGVRGPAAVSDDGTRVYFVATGVLAPGATRGRANLFLWRQGETPAGEVSFITTLDGDTADASHDERMWELNFRGGGRAARVSADGERLLFASHRLNTAYDTTEETAGACGDPDDAGDRCRQIYLFDAPSGELTCLTCVPGAPVTGDANLFGNADPRNGRPLQNVPLNLPRNLSADGTRAFFETTRRLVSSDHNNALDVYEWVDGDRDGDGELRLVSPGTGPTESRFLDASLNGNDVFFETRDRLVGIDTDDQFDLYTARVGGGLASQNPPPPSPCEGEECQGSPSGAPVLPGIASGGGSNGNARLRPRASFSVVRLTRKQRARLAGGRPVGVRVRVNRAGRASLHARAKIGKRMRAVDRASKTARRAGTVRLRLELSKATRRALARRGALALKLVVRFAGAREARSSTVRLSRASSSGEGGPR